ncbi:MAG: glycosyltransferase family 39 protein, partial [Thermoanaerobaculia bacterium]
MLLWLIVVAGLTLGVWYAGHGLHGDRFWDERYSFLNVAAVLHHGTLRPLSSYYPSPLFFLPPSALLALSDQIYDWSGNPQFAVKDDGYFTGTAYLLCRLLQVTYGAAATVLTFLIGQRMFSRQVGLLGALAVAFLPWHIRASAYFKPDALLVMTVLLAFLWSLGAIERPTAGRYALAGVGITLAMSSKLLGAVVAVPLAVGTLLVGWKERRRIAYLVLAGVTSLATFIVLNPYWRGYGSWLASLQHDYARRARWSGMTQAEIPREVFELVTGEGVLGPALGGLSFVGMILLTASSLNRRISVTD